MSERTPPGLTEAELATAMAYADGELSPDDQIAFELQMIEREELSRAVDELRQVDSILRAARDRSGGGSTPILRFPMRWLAAAGLLAGTSLAWWILGRGAIPAPPTERVAALAAASDLGPYLESHPELHEHELDEPVRGDGRTSYTPEEARAAATAVDQAWREDAERALGSDDPFAAGRFFRVSIELYEERTVIVLGRPGASDLRPLYPRDDSSPATLPPGVHLLPSPPLSLSSSGDVDVSLSASYETPFFIPRGESTMRVLVATAPAPAPGDLTSFIDSLEADTVEVSLRAAGFTIAADFRVDD